MNLNSFIGVITIQAVLYICHGSRSITAVQEAIHFVEKTMEMVNVPIQEVCFLELAEPNIMTGVKRCIEKGATRIAVVPVLLLTAGHAKKDIPEILAKVEKNHPSIEINYGKPLGIQNWIINVVAERVKEQFKESKGVEVLLIGRGSSDQEAVRDFQVIAELVNEQVKGALIKPCFLAVAQPKFPILLRETVSSGAGKVVVFPYILFTGLLMEEIEKSVNDLDLREGQHVKLCDYLGNHLNLNRALKERVMEAI